MGSDDEEDFCAYERADELDVKCRHCKEVFSIENFKADADYQCPHCDGSDSYSFCGVCPTCSECTAFHLGSFGSVAAQIGFGAVKSYLNPFSAVNGLTRFVDSVPDGTRGVCSMCLNDFTACPQCSQINQEPEGHSVATCDGCSTRFRGP